MIRRRQLLPDQQIETQTYGPVPIVSREQLDQAMLDLSSMLHIAGGCGSIVLTRHPTDFPSEMVTIHGIVEWKDRTDAKAQAETSAPAPANAEQPMLERLAEEARSGGLIDEHAQPLTTFARIEQGGDEDVPRRPIEEPVTSGELDEARERLQAAQPADDVDDGLDIAELPEEDLEAIPADQR
jgi:hypothetical protein